MSWSVNIGWYGQRQRHYNHIKSYKNTLMCYYLCCCLCVSSFGLFTVFLFYVWYLLFTPVSLIFTPNSLATNAPKWFRMRDAQMRWGWGGGDRVGSHGWNGGVLGLVHEAKHACDLTFEPNSQIQTPVWLPIPQGIGESSSADHMWVRYCSRDWNLIVYPPPYVQNGLVPFLCHGLTQLREYDQILPP